MKYYNFTEFSRVAGVDRHTLSRWNKGNKLSPMQDDEGRQYYDDSQLDEVKKIMDSSKGGRVIREDRWIDFSNINKIAGRNGYNWRKAAEEHAKVPFSYKGIDGEIEIVGISGNKISILYNNSEHTISTDSLRKCNLAFLTGSFSTEFKYCNGQRITIGNTDITILRQIRKPVSNKKAYEYICNKCGETSIVEEYNICDRGVCPVCSGRKVVSGKNDIATTASWMIRFFRDPIIADTHTCSSHDKYYMVCPDCGRISKKKIAIGTLYRTHSIGCVCSDGYSYPNKFMFNVLEQLQQHGLIKKFEHEWTPDWAEKKRYDFWVKPIDGTAFLIEMDGSLGHGVRSITSDEKDVKESLEVDTWKDEMAAVNGLEVIRVDAQESSVTYLSNNILAMLNERISIDGVDWNQADEFASGNYMKMVCTYYESHKPISVKKTAEVFLIDVSTARRYIKKGEKFGWAIYDSEYENSLKVQGLINGKDTPGRRVICYSLDGVEIKKFRTIVEAAKANHVSATAIANCCKGKTKESAGYIWKYENTQG